MLKGSTTCYRQSFNTYCIKLYIQQERVVGTFPPAFFTLSNPIRIRNERLMRRHLFSLRLAAYNIITRSLVPPYVAAKVKKEPQSTVQLRPPNKRTGKGSENTIASLASAFVHHVLLKMWPICYRFSGSLSCALGEMCAPFGSQLKPLPPAKGVVGEC